MVLVIILSILNLVSSDLTLIFVNSGDTPEALWTTLESNVLGIVEEVKTTLDFLEPVRILTFFATTNSVPSAFELLISSSSNPIIYDLTYNPLFSQLISKSCFNQNLIHIVLKRPIHAQIGEVQYGNTVFTHGSHIHEAKWLYSIVDYFGWKNLALIHDKMDNHLEIGDYLKGYIKSPKVLFTEQIFTNSDSIEKIKDELFTNIKSTKARVVFVVTNSNLASFIIKAADELGISGTGYVWIFGSNAMDGLSNKLLNFNSIYKKAVMSTGIIGIQTPADVSKNSFPNLSLTLASIIKYLKSSKYPDGSGIFSYFESGVSFSGKYPTLKIDSSGFREEDFSFYNIQNFYNIKVGYWENNDLVLDTSAKILWPGGNSDIPSDEYISILLVLIHPGDNNDEDSGILKGFNLAIKEINSDSSILADYIISPLFIQPYSSTQFIAGSLSSLDSINIIGYIGTWGNELSASYANNILSSSNPKPLVSYHASSYVLNNSIEYPYFLRTVQSDGLTATAITIFLDLMRWTKIAVLYTDDDSGTGSYYSLLENLKSYDISIENKEKYRKIKARYDEKNEPTQATLDSIEKCLQNIVEEQLKIVVYLSGSELTPRIVKDIRRKELYGQDYFWIGSYWLNDEVMKQLNSSNKIDAVQGFMSLGFRPPLDSVGKSFEESYYSEYEEQPSSYSMMVYDTVYLYAKSIEAMTQAGEDFYQVETLMNFLRIADFQAASGNLKFSEGFNDRVLVGYSLFNVQNDQLVRVMQYDPVNSFTEESGTAIIWPGDSKSVPKDSWGSSYDCPFPKVMSVSSENGLITIIMIGIGLVLLAFSISLAHYNRSRKVVFEKISNKTGKTWKDTMVQMMILVEFFQFLAIAPTFRSLNIFIGVLSNIFMLDVLKILETRSNYYWFMLSGVCGLCFVWFILMIFVIFKKTNKFSGIPILEKCLGFLIAFFLPFFGNTLFLPTLAFLLDAFVCDHQVLGKAYVWRDCYMTCWTELHIEYVVIAGFAIILYEPLAVICRPFWQEAPKDVHLKTTTTFLLFKTCFQILLITVGKALQGNFPLAHGITFTILVVIFSISTYKFSAFNYHRCNLWEITSLICLVYYSILATFSFIGDNKNIGWVVGLLFGWVMIVAVAYGIQCKYYPPLLFTEERLKDSGKIHDIDEVFPSLGLAKVQCAEDDSSKDKVMDLSNCGKDEVGDSNNHVTKNFDKNGI